MLSEPGATALTVGVRKLPSRVSGEWPGKEGRGRSSGTQQRFARVQRLGIVCLLHQTALRTKRLLLTLSFRPHCPKQLVEIALEQAGTKIIRVTVSSARSSRKLTRGGSEWIHVVGQEVRIGAARGPFPHVAANRQIQMVVVAEYLSSDVAVGQSGQHQPLAAMCPISFNLAAAHNDLLIAATEEQKPFAADDRKQSADRGVATEQGDGARRMDELLRLTVVNVARAPAAEEVADAVAGNDSR